MFPLPPMLLLAGSPGPLELLTLFAIVLILFGPRKLPGIARSIGRLLGEWRKNSETFRNQLMEIDKPADHLSKPQEKDQDHDDRKRADHTHS